MSLIVISGTRIKQEGETYLLVPSGDLLAKYVEADKIPELTYLIRWAQSHRILHPAVFVSACQFCIISYTKRGKHGNYARAY